MALSMLQIDRNGIDYLSYNFATHFPERDNQIIILLANVEIEKTK